MTTPIRPFQRLVSTAAGLAYAVLVSMVLAGAAVAQTATPTLMPVP